MRANCTLRRYILSACIFTAVCFWMLNVMSIEKPLSRECPALKRNETLRSYQSSLLENEAIREASRMEQGDLRIIAIVYNRAKSLRRLLASLNRAEYDGDDVILEVWIDRSKAGIIDMETYHMATNFMFRHGRYQVHRHSCHMGIFGQWLYSWKSSENSSEMIVILEDDLEVSPYFYKWLKLVHRKYDNVANISGYSLQGVSMKHSGASGLVDVPKYNIVYLYPVIGTWGFSPNKQNWNKFITWFSKTFPDDGFHPLVPGNVVTNWYKTFLKAEKTDTMWSIWHIYYAWVNKEYTVYPNFIGKRIQWQVSIKKTGRFRPASSAVPLVGRW